MTELIITPNYDKKTARFKGTIAGGESVKVTIVGAAKWLSSGLRLRVVCGCSLTVAMFPLKSEDGTVSSFEVEGDDLIASPLELNTIQARLLTQGLATTTATFIVEDLEKNILYFQDSYELHGWVKRDGDEEPYDLTKFPELIEDWRKQIENLIVDATEVDGGIEVTICDGVSPAKTFIIRNGRNGQPGEPGRKGEDGKSLKFSDLTEAQKAELKGPKGETGEGVTDELKALPNKVIENAQAIEANRVAINTEENRAKGAEKELLTRIEESKANAAAAMTAASKAQDTADKTVVEIATLVGDDAGDKRKSARQIAAEEVAKVIAGADTNYDTLKEIADYIKNDALGAAQLKNKVDTLDATKADTAALAAEAARAQGAEAALGGRVKELEKVSINPSYRLITLPAGETQLQDRANIHITEDNVIRTWSASTDYSGSFIDVDWVHKEVHDIGDGSGELEWYVARFGLVPGFYYPIVPVKDVKADYRYYIDYDSQPIPDDPSHGEYKGIVSEVSFVPSRITYGEVDYTANLYGDFRTKRPDTGEDITWVIDAYDTKCLLSSGGAYLYNDYVTATFGDNYTPPEWNEEDNLYWRFEVSGLSELPKPGETLKISLVLYNHNDYYNALATYEGEITLPEDLDWRFYSVSDFTLEGDATIRYSTPDGGTKEVVDQAANISINDSYNYGFVDFNFNTSAQVLPGVAMIYYQWKTVAESEEIQIPTIGEELVFSPSQSTDESSGYSEYFDTYLLMTESFTFAPPAPSSEGRARDFLLCVDLTKDRQIELQDVTEVEGGLFALNAGRTLISVTEPIEGKLYASTRPLQTENA